MKQAYVKQSYFTYLPLSQNDDSYVMYITLTRPAADQPWQDGNTRVDKVGVLQRPIQQKVKIVKDISINEDGKYEDNTFAGSGHEDSFTQNGGGTEDNAAYRPNFRFKIYLKSNLEQLYRDEEGKIDWQDRNGNIIDIAAYRAAYPEKVQKIYSKVPHLTDPLVRRSNDAAIANTELYSYTSGKIMIIRIMVIRQCWKLPCKLYRSQTETKERLHVTTTANSFMQLMSPIKINGTK